MNKAHTYAFHLSGIQRKIILLSACWICGLCFGIDTAARNAPTLSAMMHTILESRVSIVGAAAVLSFPLMLSAIAAAFSLSRLFYPVVALKAFSLGYTAHCFFLAYGSAGWLICALYLLPNFCVSALLLWLNIRQIAVGKRTLVRDCLISAFAVMILSFSYYYSVAPFLHTLSQYF